jgi:hypothetical protein
MRKRQFAGEASTLHMEAADSSFVRATRAALFFSVFLVFFVHARMHEHNVHMVSMFRARIPIEIF